ncbi:MAG: 6-phosphofructokinase [Erysipelotrichia bacterium]|nr:6-phosphofructokinase [Erysipelotrichia bacterium]
MKNLVYIQSGGPTSVINSSLYGAIKEAKKHPTLIGHIYGSRYGIEGLIDDNLIDLGLEDDEQIELLLQTPGSILGTTRKKLPKDIHTVEYTKIIDTIKKHNIGYVLINGGNDSMDTCHKIATLVEELGINDVKVIGVPKTIDNDLACTDHSLGFPSAAKYVMNAVNAFSVDAGCFKKGKVHVVEIMGRSAGWLTAAVDLLPPETRPHLIYIPEIPFDLEQFLVDVKKVYAEKGFALVAISEGLQFERDMSNVRVDGFGHVQLGGAASELCRIIESRLDLPTRAIEFSIVQRAFPSFVSLIDRKEAINTGKKAVQAALKGITGKMITFERVSQNPYKIKYLLAPLDKVANAVSHVTPDMIVDNTRMSDKFRDYLRPLVVGEVKLVYKDGLAPVTVLKHHKVK